MQQIKQDIYDETQGKYFKPVVERNIKQSRRHKLKEMETVNSLGNRKIKELLRSPNLDILTEESLNKRRPNQCGKKSHKAIVCKTNKQKRSSENRHEKRKRMMNASRVS